MSSPAVALSAPRVRLVPRFVSNEVDDAAFLSSRYGLTPDRWQEDALESWLGRRGDSRWSAGTCGLAVPRQNGKNAVIEVRELFGMVGLGERFLHTAHEVKTARKAFLRIASFFENEREYPELAGLVREVRKTNGQEAVILRNGGSVEFIARSRSSGRGFTVDVLVLDEAQELTYEQQEALLPTISAAPLRNPQVILTGTPPKPGRVQGEVFRALRVAGEAGADTRLAWTDFGAADKPFPDIDDRNVWFDHNPGLGTARLGVDEVERERRLMAGNPTGFARERLGWWEQPASQVGDLDYERWLELADPDCDRGSPVFGLDVGEDRSGHVGVAWRRPDGSVQVMVAETGLSPLAVKERVEAMTVKWPGPVMVGGPAADVDVGGRVVSGVEFAAACGRFADLLADGRIRHGNQPVLNDSVRHARWRTAGTAGERAWLLKNAPTVGPLAAVTRALAGLDGPSVYEERGVVVL